MKLQLKVICCNGVFYYSYYSNNMVSYKGKSSLYIHKLQFNPYPTIIFVP